MGTNVLESLSAAGAAALALRWSGQQRRLAQTVPTDLLDLSIEELFEANVVTEAERAEVGDVGTCPIPMRFRTIMSTTSVLSVLSMTRCCFNRAGSTNGH